MKFKQYLINEKITKKEFDEVLKNKNIWAGVEFEFYMEGGSGGNGIDTDEVDGLERKSDDEIDEINQNINNYFDMVQDLYREQSDLEEKNESLSNENESLNDSIVSYEDEIEEAKESISNNDGTYVEEDVLKLEKSIKNATSMISNRERKIEDNIDRIREIEDGEAADELQQQYEPIPYAYDMPYFFDLVKYLSDYGYIEDLDDDAYNRILYELFERDEELPGTDSLFIEIFGHSLYDIMNDPFGDGVKISEDGIMALDFPYDLSEKGWEAKPDGSLESGGVEIVTPTLPLPEIIEITEDVFEWIKTNGSTDSSTGFHVHMSMNDGAELDSLKLLLFTEEELVYKYFEERRNNTYAQSIKTGHINALEPFTIENVKALAKKEKLAKEMNTEKYQGLHLIDLENNHVEFRYMGATDYHKKFKEVRIVIANYAYWLSIASDPNFKRKEYIQKANRLTNYFNKLYLHNVIRLFRIEIKDYSDGKYLKNWDKQADKLIKPYISKYTSIPTKLKDSTIRNWQMKDHAEETAFNLFNKLLSIYDRKK